MTLKVEYEFKIIVIGESGVGKTSLSKKFYSNEFRTRTNETVVVDFLSKDIYIKDKKIKLVIFDTAGQERYRSLVSNYFRNVDGVLLVYDVTDVMTFNKLSSWLQKVKENSTRSVTLIVGNKIDHPKGKSVSRAMVKRFSRDEDLEYMETSAKNGDNVDKVFEYLTLKILIGKGLLPPDSSFSEFSTSNSTSVECEEDPESQTETEQVAETSPETENPSISQTVIEQAVKAGSECEQISATSLTNGVVELDTISLDLPPIIPLFDDIPELYVERQRKNSTSSMTSWVTDLEEFQDVIRLHKEACREAAAKAREEEDDFICSVA